MMFREDVKEENKMKPQAITKTIDMGDGRVITLETGVLAKQADGSVTVRLGDTILLATVVSTKEARDGIDFLPLTVEYREKFSAAGRFPGGFFKREARLSDHETLTCRLVDRAIRPLFPDDFHGDTQVVISMMSSDKKNPGDSLACLAASACIAVSDIPFDGPVSEVRIARVDGKFIINPMVADIERADIEMVVAGNASDILMVEGEMKADIALDRESRAHLYPFNKLGDREVNTFIFPNLSAANISYKLVEMLGGAEINGPILMGLSRANVHLVSETASVRTLINLGMIAAAEATPAK